MNKKTFTPNKNKRQAFSLIELSIVLIIIGLLIAGVTGGASLIKNAELRKVTEEARGYQTAVNSFYAKYNALPGDFATIIGTMTGASTAGVAASAVGNGDGLITFASAVSSTATGACAAVNACSRLEGNLAWQMLKNDNFVSDVFTPATADATSATSFTTALTGGTNVPASKSKGGGWAFDNITVNLASQNVVIIFGGSTSTATLVATTVATMTGSGALTNATSASATGNAQLLATDALSIDQKVDDGSSTSGKVSAVLGAAGNCSSGSGTTGIYTTTTAFKSCALAFQVDPNS